MTSGNFHDHFSGVAERYADFRPRYPAALFDYLTTLVPAGSVVWDCASGNGQAAVDLAARFASVIATDASKEQIGAAKPHPRIIYRVATAENSALAEGSVDLITVAQAVHWFAFERFYAEVRRVVRPGGVVAIWAYGINVVEGEDVNRLAYEYYSETIGPYWPPERQLVEDGYRTIPFPFEEITAPAFSMEADWTLDQLLGYFTTWSATNRYIKERGTKPLVALRESLIEVWGEPQRTRRITWPLPMRIGRVG
jgi:SAM-dependent methyltransferase